MTECCVFSTSDNKYAPMAIASLLTCRRFEKDIPLFLLGSKFTDKTKQLASENQIELVEITQNKFVSGMKKYPKECFYWLLVPKFFHLKGYKKALFIDGDICCAKPFLNVLKSDFGDFAGYFETRFIDMFKTEIKEIKALWQGAKRQESESSIQSGAVFIDIEAYEKKGIEERMVDLFERCKKNGIPRKGDDSLFALLQYLDPTLECTNLGSRYNYIVRRLPLKGVKTDDIVFYHFTGAIPKPWTKMSTWPWFTPWWYLNLGRYYRFWRAWLKGYQG